MATTVKQGSKGSEVTQLQTLLNQQGFSLAVDGIFGAQTAATVRQYQQKMGLTIDGIVGVNTWGALTSGGTGSGQTGSYYDPSTGQMMPPGWTPGQGGASGSVSGSGLVNAGYSFEQLLAELNRNPYTPLSEAEILGQARSSYDPIYNANREGLNQAAEQYYLALDQRLGGLGESYDRQRTDTARAYADAESNAGRAMLQRGMGRSSFGSQVTAQIGEKGAQAQADINAAQTREESGIMEQRTLYEQQLGQSLTRLATDYETNITNYANQLRDRERDREIAAQQYGNQLALSLYEAAVSQAQWEAQFMENQRQFNAQLAESQRQFNQQMAKSSSGGGSSAKTSAATTPSSSSLSDFLGALGSGGEVNKWALGGSAHTAYVASGSPTGGNAVTAQGQLVNAIKKASSTTSTTTKNAVAGKGGTAVPW